MKTKYALIVGVLFMSMSLSAQTNYLDWANAGQPDLSDGQPRVAQPANRGGLITFADRPSFDLEAGVLPLEDFEGGLTVGVSTCTEPVNSSSNDTCFVPGDLIDGFNVTSSTGGGVVILDDLLGPTTDVIGANSFPDFAIVSFTDLDVTAVALDAFSGNPGAGDVTVRVFDASDNSLGSVVVTTTANNVSEFVGFISPVAVGRIEIEGAGGSGELFDNLAFGTPVVELPESQPVPTLGMFGMIAAALMLLLIAGIAVRKRSI